MDEVRVAVYGHVLCAEGGVELFVSGDIGALEPISFHKLEEDAVVHASECTFEV